MTRVKLVASPRKHDYAFPRTFLATQDCDCGDCACPIDSSAVPTLDMPIFYSLEITPVCNNRCVGCSNVFDREPNPLSYSQWCKILDDIRPYVSRLKVTGGEPSLHPDFAYIIECIEQREIPFTLFTNARWPATHKMVDMLKTQKSCVGLLISLHGAVASTHEVFTGVSGSFKETVANIRLATAAGLTVHLSCVLTQHNVNEVDALVALSKELGASMIVFNRYIGVPVPGFSLEPRRLALTIEQIGALQNAGEPVHFGTCIPQCFVKSTSTGCLAGTAYCTIDPWGNVRPCNHVPWITGNLLTDSLTNAWNSEAMVRWRALMPPECLGCLHFSQCRGGCRAEAVLNSVDRDPLVRTPGTRTDEIPSSELTPLHLYRDATITLSCDVREQGFGYLLLRGDRLAPTTSSLAPVLATSGSGITLQEIQDEFGQSALDSVGELYEQGFIALTW